MPLLIGLDEAGYGPNLGPLVVAATVWEVAEDPRTFDPWVAFDGVVSQAADPSGKTVHVADSKVVHAASAGIAAVERSATTILRLANRGASSLHMLWDDLTGSDHRADCGEPWFCGNDVSLPMTELPQDSSHVLECWLQRCESTGCRLVDVVCEIVPARRFNGELQKTGSKGRLLSEATLALLRRVWDPADDRDALVLCDKHGGRNRYADLLADTFPDEMPLGLEESSASSRYRVGSGEIRFQARSEAHLPVAAASLVAKYLREACMEAMNAFWIALLPDLRPTRGYPLDARRYLREIEADAAGMGLERETYWRLK
ncbi:MAG: hypothetical protein WBC44_14275 [Planctomycetaceae bacterium]